MSTELITIIRPSFMKFCQDGCKAATFNHILYWIARKAKNEPQEKIQAGEVMWYATTEEIAEGMSNAWGVCKVRKEVNEIIDMGIIGRGKNPTWGADRTKHFFFGSDQCAKLLSLFQKHAICIDCLGLPGEVTQMINLSNTNHKIIVYKCLKHQMETIKSSDAIDKSIEAITKVSTKVTSKDNNKGKERATSTQTTKPASVQSVFSLEEQKIVDWYAQLGTGHKTKLEKAKEILPDLLQRIHSFEEMQELHDYTAKRLREEEKADQTVYLATMRYYMLKRLKERPAQIEQEDPGKLVLHTRYRVYEDFPASPDLWFLFEEMTIAEANKHDWAERGSMGNRTGHLIRMKLEDSDEATRQRLAKQWVNERMAVAV